MPIGTITNGESGSSVRTKLNSVIGAVNNLGTAATTASTDYATAAQGALADSAVQPGDIGTAAAEDVGYFATAAQGALADTALQPDQVKSSNFTAANNGRYVVTASLTVTDPSPEEGKGFVVVVRNGTATIGGTGYNTAGSQIRRIFHSGGWATYVDSLTTHTHADATTSVAGFMSASDKTKLDGIEAGADVTDATNVALAGAVMSGGALGTPASGTLTNCTGLPVAGITSSTTQALGVGSIELGHASDTTLARSSAGNMTIEGNLVYRAGGSFVGMPVELVIACSDETTALTTGTAKVTFRMPYAMTLTAVRASVTTAPTGSTLVVDINESGSSILSTKLSIDASEKTSTTAATAAVISDSALADDAEITIDIDQIGSTIAGAGLKVTLIGTRA